MSKKVSIILVNYNTTQDTINCVESLSNINYKNYDIIIIDNESRKDEFNTLDTYVRNKKKCVLVKSGKNGGFAYGNNIGIDTCWFNRYNFINDKDVKVTYEIKNLYELIDLL